MDSHLQSSPAQLAIDSQIAHLQAELTTHIARTKATICALYEQRNALSPMSRLPEELLCQIYFALQQHRDPQGLRGWKVVTAVSRAWRAAAMASPSLWATVDCGYTSLKDADIAFERSGSSGLRIRGWLQSRDVRWSIIQRSMALLVANVARARAVSLEDVSRSSSNWDAWQAWPSQAPLLQSLSLSAAGSDQGDQGIPTAVLECTYPMLRSLSLKGFIFPWNALKPLTNLVNLKIDCLVPRRSSEYMSSILETIQGLPRLESIGLDISESKLELQDAPDITLTSYPMANLQQLKELEIYAETMPVALVLLLHISPPCQSLFVCNWSKATGNVWLTEAQGYAFAARIREARLAMLRHGVIMKTIDTICAYERDTRCMWSIMIQEANTAEHTMRNRIHLLIEDSIPRQSRILNDILDAVDLPTMTYASLSGRRLPDIIPHLQACTTLSISPRRDSEGLDRLRLALRQPWCLRTLAIDAGGGKHSELHEEGTSSTLTAAANHLLSWIVHLVHSGSPLERVELFHEESCGPFAVALRDRAPNLEILLHSPSRINGESILGRLLKIRRIWY